MIKDHVKCCNCDPDEPEVNELTPDQRLEGMAGEFLDKENMKEITGQPEQGSCPSEDELRTEALISEMLEGLKEALNQLAACNDELNGYFIAKRNQEIVEELNLVITKAEGREVDPTIATMLAEHKRIQDGELIALKWSISDILGQAMERDIDLDSNDAQDILKRMDYDHDVSNGSPWDVMDYYIDEIVSEREAK